MRKLRIEALEDRRLLATFCNDDLAHLCDEFDDPATIDSWNRINETEGWNADHLQQWDINQTQPGRMHMAPHTTSWYQDWRGPMAYREVTGDFVYTTELHISDRDDIGDSDDDDVPGDSQYSLAGLMIRTPRAITDPATDWQPGSRSDVGNQGENYVFLSMGYADGNSGNDFQLEVKTTRNSESNLEITNVPSADHAELRVARIGNSVFVMHRLPFADWVIHRRYDRPDMPETLQLGLVTYTDWGKASDYEPFFMNSNVITQGVFDPTPSEPINPDIQVGYEYVRVGRPEVPVELQGVDLFANATDEELLDFLGDPPAARTEPLRIGMNLEDIVDWSPAWVFKDVFKSSRPWFSHSENTVTGEFSFSGGGEVHLDENGWPTVLNEWTNDDGQQMEQWLGSTMFCCGSAPAGIYRAEWDGVAEMIWNRGNGILEQGTTPAGRSYALLDVAAEQEIWLALGNMDINDPIREVNLWMPDYNGQSFVGNDWHPGDVDLPGNLDSPFHPLFLERLGPFGTLRFMQTAQTNTSEIETWEDRKPVDYATQSSANWYATQNGIAPEYMIELSNELAANPWFNMPHGANDDFVRNFAELARDTLDPDLDIYLEWSNEVWNWAAGFDAYHWVTDQLALPENAEVSRWEFVAQEISRDFEIWSDVFVGQQDRLVRTIGGQLGNPWLAEQILSNMNGEFDAISPTAYAGLGGVLLDDMDANTTVDEVVDTLLNVSVPWSLAGVAAHQNMANDYSRLLGREIQVVNYEGGSHPGAWNHPAMDVIYQASQDERMGEVYDALLDGLNDIGVDLYAQYVFTGAGEPTPWGDFALLHEMDQPLSTTHEYNALVDFIEAHSASEIPSVISVSPNGGVSNPADLNKGGQPTSWQTQKSQLQQISIEFNVPVNVALGDFQLTNLGVDAANDVDVVVPLDTAVLVVDGSVVVLQLPAGLMGDGIYQLQIQDGVTSAAGVALDGDDDGAAGGSYVISGDLANGLYQITADWNGDGGISVFDFTTFSYWFGEDTTIAPSYVDLNNDGGISVFDFTGFSQQFGSSIQPEALFAWSGTSTLRPGSEQVIERFGRGEIRDEVSDLALQELLREWTMPTGLL
ncbi:MAG: hypothetical protein ACI9G1_005091 [Pirellulaceae bacterium]|jgi:hypothetical protein